MKRILLLIGLVAVIPICGYLIGSYIAYDYEKEWSNLLTKEYGSKGVEAIASGQLTLQRFCDDPEGANQAACQTYKSVQLLKNASVVTLLTGLALLLAIFLAARISASSRVILVNVFSPGIKVVLLILFALILVQGAIATYSAYLFESTAIHSVHIFIIGGIGIGALAGAFAMIKAGWAISKRATTRVIGKTVTAADEPQLWSFVTDAAKRLGATPPRNIVLGLEPNFYVTSADVVVYPGALKQPNETLYLSLPLMRVLSREEIAAVIGHELGHFRGKDTKFSLRFYPIYAGTAQALKALHSQSTDGARSLALIPAFAILSFFMEQFAQAERTIGRSRELEADKAGVSIASSRALASSLLKIGTYAPLWGTIRKAMIEALNKGKAYTNVSALYAEMAAQNRNPALLDDVATIATTHPTDTHPPTSLRIQVLGLSVADLRDSALNFDMQNSSMSLLSSASQIEEELTQTEHSVLLELGMAQLPEIEQQS